MCYVTGWYRGEKRAMMFSIPRIWPQPTDHSSNCYFCMVDPTKCRTGKNAPQIVYPDIPSSIAPVSHCPELPVPSPPKRDQPSSGDSSKSDTEEDIGDPDYVFTDALRREGHTSLTRKTNDLTRKTKDQRSDQRPWSYQFNAEFLVSRLKQWNLLMKACKSQIREGVTKHFPTSSVGKMGFASTTMWPVYSRLLVSPVTRVNGTYS